jgi:hypothetical protein
MSGEQFDELVRQLGGGRLSRRQILTTVLAAALGGGLSRPGGSEASPPISLASLPASGSSQEGNRSTVRCFGV